MADSLGIPQIAGVGCKVFIHLFKSKLLENFPEIIDFKWTKFPAWTVKGSETEMLFEWVSKFLAIKSVTIFCSLISLSFQSTSNECWYCCVPASETVVKSLFSHLTNCSGVAPNQRPTFGWKKQYLNADL